LKIRNGIEYAVKVSLEKTGSSDNSENQELKERKE